jgi:multisubunit Na+/H+ antiporter MnhB subunit
MMRSVVLFLTLALLGIALFAAFRDAPALDAPLSGVAQIYADETVEKTTSTNVVAAINFDWRAYDTLGESTILLTAAAGVTALLRRYLQRRRETGLA